MATPSLDDLLVPRTRDDLEQILISRLQDEGFPVTDWFSGSVARTIVKAIATVLADRETLIRYIASGQFLSLAAELLDPDGNPVEVERVALTKVEADAERPDEARRMLVRCYVIVDRLVADLGDLADSLGGETLPTPEERVAARLAFVQWQINKIVRLRTVPRSGVGRLESSVRLVNELASICATYRPAPKQVRPVDVCHAHDAAGLDSAIDSKYRRWHLCRWCGDFRSTHGVNPPPKLVRLHDRGISMSTSLLRSAGIRIHDSRRGA